MTEIPRSTLLRRARRRTAALVIGTLAGTGLLTVAIAAAAPEAAVQHGSGTTPTQQSDRSGRNPGITTGGTGSGLGPSTSSGGSDGGSSAS